jgi:anti-sigma factor RsiW
MTSITPEELAAFADGELDAAREAEVAAAVAADPAFAAQVRAHRALKAKLDAHFAPILDAPLPEGMTALLQRREAEVIDFAAARNRRIVRWSWIAAPALAASLALAVFMPRGDEGYATGALAETLDTQLVAAQPADAETRILLSFRDQAGSYCRAFAGEAQSGIACRDAEGWRLVSEGKGAAAQAGEYRMAGNPAAELLERAQAMAAGPAVDAAGEEAARARGWR